MDQLSQVISGFAVALQPGNLLFTFIGVLLGTLVGVLPGLGSATTIAILAPVAMSLDPTSALIMMCGVYYGSMYGGSTTSILINTPGEASAMMTAIDGYRMAQQGRAGAALAISAIGSFVAGTLGIVALSLLAVPLASIALDFGPPEYFALMLFAMSAISALTGGSPAKSLIAAIAGLMLSTIGVDSQSGVPRYTFGMLELQDGVGLTLLVVGLFAVGEALTALESVTKGGNEIIPLKGRLLLTREEWRASAMPVARGSLIGFAVGLLPGAGATISTILAYAAEKRLSKTPERFGHGAIEGVAAPEAANNASSAGAMVPLLSLGIPGSGTAAVLLGVFIMYGIQPGPLLFQSNPDLVWGLVDSMYVGNVMLLILNLPLVFLFVRLLYIPQGILFPIVLALAVISVYAVIGNTTELYLMLFFGTLGYVFRKLDIPVGPMVLGFVLGAPLEQSFRQSMTLSAGDPTILAHSPIAAGLLIAAIGSLAAPYLSPKIRRWAASSDDATA